MLYTLSFWGDSSGHIDSLSWLIGTLNGSEPLLIKFVHVRFLVCHERGCYQDTEMKQLN